jgi:hypothetical protein
MSAPSFDISSSSNTQIKLTWTALSGTATGGSGVSIDTYNVEWDQGTATWVSLSNVVSPTSFYTKTGLTGGTTYQFRVYAVNKYGNGATSLTTSIKAGQAPAVPSPPTTSVPTNSVYLEIAWTAPTANNFAIDMYEVKIKKSDATYNIDLTYCDGSSSTVVANLNCLIPMTVLRAAPYNLVYGDAIKAQVQAHNERGWSGFSADSTTFATVQTEPTAMAAPARGASTSET